MSMHSSTTIHRASAPVGRDGRTGRSLFGFLGRIATARSFWTTLAAFVAIMVAYSVVNLPQIILRATGYTGSLQWYAIDNAVGAPTSKVYADLATYGSIGRAVVIVNHLTFDVLFPLAYMTLLAISLTLIGRSLFGLKGPWRWLTLMPVAAGLCDFAENIGIVAMCLAYPTHATTLGVARLTSTFTSLKFSLLAVSLVLVLLGTAAVGVRRGIARVGKERVSATA